MATGRIAAISVMTMALCFTTRSFAKKGVYL
jgi:hypothetical protein